MAFLLRGVAAARQTLCGPLQSVTSQSYRCLQTLCRYASGNPISSRFTDTYGSALSAAVTVIPRSSLLSSSSLISTPTFACTSDLLSASKLLSPITLTQSRGYHVRLALKKRCSSCYFVRRKGRLYVDCKAKPRHKQMQMMSKRKTWKEDYSKGNIERAIFWKYDGQKRYYKLGDNQYARYDWLKGKIGVTV